MFWIGFIVGTLAGCMFGVFAMALAVVGRTDNWRQQ